MFFFFSFFLLFCPILPFVLGSTWDFLFAVGVVVNDGDGGAVPVNVAVIDLYLPCCHLLLVTSPSFAWLPQFTMATAMKNLKARLKRKAAKLHRMADKMFVLKVSMQKLRGQIRAGVLALPTSSSGSGSDSDSDSESVGGGATVASVDDDGDTAVAGVAPAALAVPLDGDTAAAGGVVPAALAAPLAVEVVGRGRPRTVPLGGCYACLRKLNGKSGGAHIDGCIKKRK